MNKITQEKLLDLIETYNRVMAVMEHDAAKAMKEDMRAYGGFVRSAKGKMQEYITEQIVLITWIDELSQNPNRITINSDKIRIPIQMDYVHSIKDKDIKDYILANIKKYYYGLSVDKHIFIDNKFLIGIECKAYTENAMIKRILVDFYLLKTQVPNLLCYLFQLESQLGGDYSQLTDSPKGSRPTHTLMSFFKNLELNIITLLPGDRKVDKPINKPQFFKPLTIKPLEQAVNYLSEAFQQSNVIKA